MHATRCIEARRPRSPEQGPFGVAGPQLRIDGMTVRDIATLTRDKHVPNNVNFLGTLAKPGARALRDKVHLPKLSEDACSIDSKHFDWKGLFGDLVLRNFGVKDPSTQAKTMRSFRAA